MAGKAGLIVPRESVKRESSASYADELQDLEVAFGV